MPAIKKVKLKKVKLSYLIIIIFIIALLLFFYQLIFLQSSYELVDKKINFSEMNLIINDNIKSFLKGKVFFVIRRQSNEFNVIGYSLRGNDSSGKGWEIWIYPDGRANFYNYDKPIEFIYAN